MAQEADEDLMGSVNGKVRAHRQSISRSTRSGLQFPVGRIRSQLARGGYAQRQSASASVYIAAVLEYLAAEVLELAGNVTRDDKRRRLTPGDIHRAVCSDEELSRLFVDVLIQEGGMTPHIEPFLLKSVKAKKAALEQES